MTAPAPARGETWWVDLGPVRGHEQDGRRPSLVVSDDRLNRGKSGLVIVVPMTTRDRPIPTWVAVEPPEGGLSRRSFVQCEQVKSISTERLVERIGSVETATMAQVCRYLRALLKI